MTKKKKTPLDQIIDGLENDLKILDDKDYELTTEEMKECLANIVGMLYEMFKHMRSNREKESKLKFDLNKMFS